MRTGNALVRTRRRLHRFRAYEACRHERARTGLAATWAACCVLASACAGEGDQLPPLPEVLVVVDTNVPVPLAASRLRIDLFDAEGSWFDSSDVALPSPADWPASFSVYSEDESRTRAVWVRLRAYGEGRHDDYRGERFRDWHALFESLAPGDGEPRLLKGGVDVTPRVEPTPLLTIDRLLLVELVPRRRGSVRVLLDGACMGTMSKLGPRGRPADGAETCTREERARTRVSASTSSPDMSRGGPSMVGSYASDPCRPGEGSAERICVPGGATILGVDGITDYVDGVRFTLPPRPARFFSTTRFLIDRDEVTVGRYREKVGPSWRGRLPRANEGPLLTTASTVDDPTSNCTWSSAPRGREGYALNCIDWEGARTFCRSEGGDLPTELQWEHVATVAGKDVKTRYPWGDEILTCDAGVFGRYPGWPAPFDCVARGLGPAAYDQSAGDRSPLGVVALGANLTEWTLDDGEPYTAPCWREARQHDPRCFHERSALRVLRGASWATGLMRGTFRTYGPVEAAGAALGFRCVYPVSP